jgi:hypothetical protein
MRRSSHARVRKIKPTSLLLRVLSGLCTTASLASPSVALAQEEDSFAGTSSTTHTVVKGDTLWDLSGRFMGSTYEWPRLWSFNPEITNPHWIYPGHVLRLREGAVGGMPGEEGGVAPAGQARLLRRGGSGLANVRGTVLLGEQVYLDEQALREAARVVGSPEDHMMFSPTDEVYLQFKKTEQINEGKELVVFRHLHRAELLARAGRATQRIYAAGEGGEVVRVVGVLRVRTIDHDKRIARAVVTEALDPIERGFEVADVPRTLADVPPKVSTRKVEARIVSCAEPLGQLGENQIVFIDAGSKQGVQTGNRFVVLRQGDAWRQSLYLKERMSGEARPDSNPLPDKAYPWHAVGEARAIYVREQSTTALITDALVELNPGDRVELREGY